MGVEIPQAVARSVAYIALDGLRLESPEQGIALRDDRQRHHVEVILGRSFSGRAEASARRRYGARRALSALLTGGLSEATSTLAYRRGEGVLPQVV